jgi:LysR family transcriptional regulator, carnitine catabolism transcriptional activator
LVAATKNTGAKPLAIGTAVEDLLADASISASSRSRVNVSFKQILAFLSVADTENFTAAADALCTTQSAVSNLIKELERELDLRLFERTTRSVRLTEEGREFLVPAKRVFAEFQAAIGTARAMSEQRRGKITVAASPLMASLLLPEAIAEFHALYPKINVVLRDAPYDKIRQLVLDGSAEIGFGRVPDDTPGLSGEVLVSGALNLIFRAGHPLETVEKLTWQAIAEHPFIALTVENGTRQAAEQCMAEAGVTITPAYEVSFIWTAISMVEAGLGVCVVPCYVRMLGGKQNIRIRAIEPGTVKTSIGLISRSDKPLSPAAAHFQKFIRGYIH